MKTVKTIVKIIMVIALLPLFASATTGVAIANVLKGEELSLSFVEKSILTTVNFAKSLINVLKTATFNVFCLILLGIHTLESFAGKVCTKVSKFKASLFAKLKGLVISSKTKTINAFENAKAFLLNQFLNIKTTLSPLAAKLRMRKLGQEVVEDCSENKSNDVSIDLELRLTDELMELMNLESKSTSLKASLTISKEVAVNLLNLLSSVKTLES